MPCKGHTCSTRLLLQYVFDQKYLAIVCFVYYNDCAPQNGSAVRLRQNEYILRTSSINGGGTYGKYGKGINLMIELIVEVVGIVVTVISIIVTVISIRQTTKKEEHQKSNRPDQG